MCKFGAEGSKNKLYFLQRFFNMVKNYRQLKMAMLSAKNKMEYTLIEFIIMCFIWVATLIIDIVTVQQRGTGSLSLSLTVEE
jgi:hypothetical protein